MSNTDPNHEHMEPSYCKVLELYKDRKGLPTDYELVIEIVYDECWYYFVDHKNERIFWPVPVSPEDDFHETAIGSNILIGQYQQPLHLSEWTENPTAYWNTLRLVASKRILVSRPVFPWARRFTRRRVSKALERSQLWCCR